MSTGAYTVYVECMTYNHEPYIVDALRGFVQQETTFPFIVVIIDDASTDGTANVIECFVKDCFDITDKSIAYELETEEGHFSFARHKTNRNCFFAVWILKENHYSQNKSKEPYIIKWRKDVPYVATCEGDDYWIDAHKLQKQVDFLSQHQDYVMCCTAFSYTNNGDESNKVNVVYDDKDEISIEDLLQDTWIGTLTVMYRREAMEAYCPPYDNLLMGDLCWWFYLSIQGKIKYIKDITANYRSISNSASHFKDSQKQFLFYLSAMRIREHYARASNRLDIAAPYLCKHSHFYLDECFRNKWFDFPFNEVWQYVCKYGVPSFYDRIKYWGLQSSSKYQIARTLLILLGKC